MLVNKPMSRGDTIIEVMLAITIFAMLSVGVLTLMNRGVASAQDALETTLVRQQIDGQAETLRFLHQAYMLNPNAPDGSASVFKDIINNKKASTASEFGSNGNGSSCIDGIPSAGFALNPGTAKIIGTPVKSMNDSSAPAYAQLTESTITPYGIWVEAVEGESDAGSPRFYDFHIRACWSAAVSSVPRTLGTIVRLYVP
jgi:type II secretory pathway pseudopilin PulG